MRRTIALFMSFLLLVLLGACGTLSGGTENPPVIRQKEPLVTGDLFADAPTDVAVPQEVSDWYREMEPEIQTYMDSLLPVFSELTQPFSYLNSSGADLFLMLPIIWQMDFAEDGSMVSFFLACDDTGTTRYLLTTKASEEIPWLTFFPEEGGTVISTNFDALVEHAPDYWEEFKNGLSSIVRVEKAGEPRVMFIGCCQGAIMEIEGTVEGEPVRGCYLIWANEHTQNEVLLTAREPYYEYAYFDMFQTFENSGHYIHHEEEVAQRLKAFEALQPQR
jgi:hypothetical protein